MAEQYLPDKWPMDRLQMVTMKLHRVVSLDCLVFNMIHNWIHQQVRLNHDSLLKRV